MVKITNKTTNPTDFQNGVLASIDKTAESANAEKEIKRAKYEQALSKFNIIEEAKYYAYKSFKTIQTKYRDDKNNFTFRAAKEQYNSICSNYSAADTDVSILRSSYQNSIFFSGKMNTIAIIADSMNS